MVINIIIISISAHSQNPKGPKYRDYTPKPGSGGYAILITLYEESLRPDYKGYMTKAEVCKKAQPLSETNLSYSQPGNSGPGSWYTGWNSAETLVIKKGLVIPFLCFRSFLSLFFFLYLVLSLSLLFYFFPSCTVLHPRCVQNAQDVLSKDDLSTFGQMDFWLNGHFVKWAFRQMDILSFGHFVKWTFCQKYILLNGRFVEWTFCRIDVLSNWYFVKMVHFYYCSTKCPFSLKCTIPQNILSTKCPFD